MPEKMIPRILVACEGHIATVDLVATYPLSWLSEDGLCTFKYIDVKHIKVEDLLWCDILFLIRGLNFLSKAIAKTIKKYNKTLIYFWDDNPFDISGKSLSFNAFSKSRDNIIFISKISDLVLTNNQFNASVFAKYSGRSVDSLFPLPPAIEPLYAPKYHDKSAAKICFGFAGSLDHKYLIERLIFPALQKIKQSAIDFRFEIIGPIVDMPYELKENVVLLDHTSNYKQWIKLRNSLSWAFTLAPLTESVATSCKSPNKFVEFGCVGIPGIFSNVTPYKEIIENGQSGLLVENNIESWSQAITVLVNNEDMRNEIGLRSWQTVNKIFGRTTVIACYIDKLKPAFNRTSYRRNMATKKTIVCSYIIWLLNCVTSIKRYETIRILVFLRNVIIPYFIRLILYKTRQSILLFAKKILSVMA